MMIALGVVVLSIAVCGLVLALRPRDGDRGPMPPRFGSRPPRSLTARSVSGRSLSARSVSGRSVSGRSVALWLAVIAGGGALVLVGALTTAPSIPQAAPLPAKSFHGVLRSGLVKNTPPVASAVSTAPEIGPDELVVPSLGVRAPVVLVGIAHHDYEVPGDVHIVGEWKSGSRPMARAGTVLIAGHVNWVGQGPGALSTLAHIAPGARIFLSGASGHASAWAETGIESMAHSALPQTVFDAGGPHRLVLVTCGGAFSETASGGSYADNVVVIATPIPSPR